MGWLRPSPAMWWLVLTLGALSWGAVPSMVMPGAVMQKEPKRLRGERSLLTGLEMGAIWEALQDVAPGNWQAELVERLALPVPEDSPWGASQMAEELRLFQAVSEHLLQSKNPRPPSSSTASSSSAPHLRLLGLLTIHGSSRLLQASLGPCLSAVPGSAQEEQQQWHKSLVGPLMGILSSLEAALQSGLENGRTGFALEAPLLSLSLHRLNSSQLGAAELSFPSSPWAARVVLPEQSALGPFLPPEAHVDVQMGSFLGSPFFPSGSSTQRGVTGTVAELDLRVRGTEVRVSNLSAPVQIFLPQASPTVDWGPVLSVSPGESLLLTVKGWRGGGSLGVHVRTRPPQLLGLFLLQWNQQLLQPSAVDPDGYSWLVGPEVLLTHGGAPRFLLVTLNLSAEAPPVSMHIRAYGVQCLSWDPPSAQWRAEGCKVGPQSRQEPGGHCLCSHLSVFGASFWVAPVQIDLVRTAEYFGRVSQNSVLAILLGVLYGLFLAGLAWACWMDTRRPPQVGAALLPEEDPCAQYVYLLSVISQEPSGPSYSPGLCISLQGSFGTSNPRRLPCPGTFLLREPCPLGEMQGIWLWQESLGALQRPRYIPGITVWDLPQKRHFHFPCNAWLAAGEDGPITPQHFPTATLEKAFWPIFRQRTLSGLWEEHTVLLVLRPPPHSPFSRAQRLSCGWSLLLCSALISLMFWESPQGDSTPLLLDAGSVFFSLSWKDVVIGVQSALLAFPINFLVVFVFQRTKARKGSQSPGQASPTAASAPSDPTSLQAAVLEDLHSAVEVLSRGSERPEPGQTPLPPTLGLEELLQLLHHFILSDGRGGTANESLPAPPTGHTPVTPACPSECAQPSTPPGTPGPTTAASSLYEAYCTRFLLLKLQHVERLLEELGAGPFPGEGTLALQRVQEMRAALATRSTSACPSCRKWHQWSLPWWGSLMGWALLLSLNAVSTFFILLYGFHYGKESTERWLISTAVSLLQSLLVLQPLKVVCFAIFFALKKAEEEEPAVEEYLDLLGERLGPLQ